MTRPLPALIDSPALGPRPFLTWYGDGERIEISATVTANWVAKTTGLLVEEYDAGPGTLVHLDLPPHWRSAVWALAAWRVGAGLVLDATAPADVVVTDRPADVAAGTVPGVDAGRAEIVAQVMPSLARSFPGDLPARTVDAARAVGSYPDVIGYVPPLDPGAAAVVVGGKTTTHAELGAWAADLPPSARLAVTLGGRAPHDLERYFATVLGALHVTSSLVLLGPDHPEPSRILPTENATPHDVG